MDTAAPDPPHTRGFSPGGYPGISIRTRQHPLFIPFCCNTPCDLLFHDGCYSANPPSIVAGPVPALETDSIWSRRKPTHLGVESAAPAGRGPVLSNARSLVFNAPSANSVSSPLDVPSENTQKRATVERLRRKLGEEVPADAVLALSPRTPHTPPTAASKTSKAHARSRLHAHTRSTYARAEDTQSITISISSDEGLPTVALKLPLPMSILLIISRICQRRAVMLLLCPVSLTS
ncbi:hypothetical protein EDC04DRAFT_3149095 [Pisolithus marmoratus]|nr:hypothetical protein EDC04DRAFT_3149095 [Pisolithus marmoratus]